jgi:hypothetical protein
MNAMKNLLFILIASLFIILKTQAQENEPKVWLGYLTANFTNPSYVNGKLKEMTQISYDAKLIDGKIEKGDRIKNLVNASLRHATFLFNEIGEMIKATFYDDEGEPQWIAIVDNENGRVHKITYLLNQSIERYDYFLYDDLGLTEVRFCKPENNDVVRKTIFQNNDKGMMVKSETFNDVGEKTNEGEIIRDEKGRIHVVTYKNNSLITNRTEYFYGSHFEPISMDQKIANDEPVDIKGRRVHFFDDKGNWIKQIRFMNDEPVNITERTYVFYQHPL